MDIEMSTVASGTNGSSAGSRQSPDDKSYFSSAPAKSAFVCETCGKVFTTKYAQLRHMRLHTGDTRHACHYPGCNRMFTRRDHLRHHLNSHERIVRHASASPLATGSAHAEHTAEAELVLQDAEMEDAELDFILQDTDEALSAADIQRKKTLLAGRLPCHHCEQTFERAELKRLHTIPHSGHERYFCHVSGCNISFDRLDYLQTHLEVHVEPGRSLDALREAQLAFMPNPRASGASLERASQDIGRGQHMCPRQGCGRVFNRHEGVSAHVRVHQDGPFKCPTCGKGLSRKDKLTAHMRLHEEYYDSGMSSGAVAGQTAPRKYLTYICHACGYSTGRRRDLKRHLASNAHDKHALSYRHGYQIQTELRQAIGAGRNGLLGAKDDSGEEDDDGNGGLMEPEEDQDGSDESNPLENFLSQLVAAANPGDLCMDEQSTTRAFRTDTGTGESHSPIRILDTTDERVTKSKAHQAAGSAQLAVPSTLQSTVSPKPETAAALDVDGAKLRRPKRTPTGTQVPQQSHTKPSASQSIASRIRGARLCYGCGHVFWDAKIFWSHGPCFTTTTASNARDLPNQAGRAPASTEAVVKQQPAQQSTPVEKPDLGRATVNTRIPTTSIDELEATINVVPSAQVQQLLVSLAMRNPEARPIPPVELRSLMLSEPNMLDHAARMKRGMAVLREWLKEKHADRISERQATRPAPVQKGQQRGGAGDQMAWTCKVKPATMATILCYAKPGEDLDWTKITNRAERQRLREVIKTRQKKERVLHSQGRDESGGDYPGAAGVRLMLMGQVLPSNASSTDLRPGRSIESKRQPDSDASQNRVMQRGPGKHKVLHHAALTTASGLRLLDGTFLDQERLIEDDVP